MPEGPELHLAARLVNQLSAGRIYSGQVVKSEVSTKNPDVNWNEPAYTIAATSRGKEVKLILTAMNECENVKSKSKKSKGAKKMDDLKTMNIIFRFGMSGKFTFGDVSKMHKHAHLNFYAKEDDMVLSFTDYRRFGRWEINTDWGKDRGPCVILEYEEFRENVLQNLHLSAFNKPICEALLNQKFFNGIGNYLRAEILYRLSIPPFTEARKVLTTLVENKDVKSEEPDLLQLCNLLPLEVLALGDGTSTGYDPEAGNKDYDTFNNWLQCYYKEGMKNMVDHNSRTIWFNGPAGPMTPAAKKTRMKKKSGGSKETLEDCQDSPPKKQKTSRSDRKAVKSDQTSTTKQTRKSLDLKAVKNDQPSTTKQTRKSLDRKAVKSDQTSTTKQTRKSLDRKAVKNDQPSTTKQTRKSLDRKAVKVDQPSTTKQTRKSLAKCNSDANADGLSPRKTRARVAATKAMSSGKNSGTNGKGQPKA